MKVTRYLCLLLGGILVLFAFPVSASANGPAPMMEYYIYLFRLPEGTVYVDLLIPMEKEDPCYTDLVSENLPKGITPQSQIVTYHEEGLCSYTFHYKNAQADILVEEDKIASFCFGDIEDSFEIAFDHVEDIQKRGEIRLAMLDHQGNILQVSSRLSTILRNPFAIQTGGFTYNAETDRWEQDIYVSVFAVAVYIIISLAGLGMTCLVEWLMAWPFGLRKSYGRVIQWTNVVSQIAMRLAHILLQMLLLRSYFWTVILLEVPVYAGEYLFYRMRMQDRTWKRVLAYTIAANTASLIVGHYLNLWM